MPGLVVVVGSVLALSAPAAHRSFAVEYDANKPLSLRGTVATVEWTNVLAGSSGGEATAPAEPAR